MKTETRAWIPGRRRTLAILGLCLAATVAWFLIFRSEPRHNGKSLSTWLREVDSGRFNYVTFEPVLNDRAAAAIREIGPAAIPILIRRMRLAFKSEDKFYSLQDLPTRIPFQIMDSHLEADIERGREAILGFRALGTKGDGAVSNLNQMLGDVSDLQTRFIFDSLAAIGPASLPVFNDSLNGFNVERRKEACWSAGLLGRAGSPLVPSLCSIVNNTNENEHARAFAARSLGRIGEPPDVVLACLRNLLSATNESLKRNAALGLALMGERATQALPDLERCLSEGSSNTYNSVLLGLIVLCTNDTRIVNFVNSSLSRPEKGLAGTNSASSAASTTEAIAFIRKMWTNCDGHDRMKLISSFDKILQPVGTN